MPLPASCVRNSDALVQAATAFRTTTIFNVFGCRIGGTEDLEA
jgi:hypothetical protein